ncbi:hydroxymethylglutaryl-CoA lyase [Rubrivivax rivuli]|uniref:Hydroxymethylglutaryl-CoA lyase n=1 Tax=Rubrivivax rivuli TaxID=1862385 RepID=A0A437RRA9_9BURK|nr:hydroxymethylglutaryl-CoA lyase [Rubrivivax rivuli]RVU49330.1 hydroxymethylglutaryl-CoA lyase [Rubrivivax rivuli]
MPALPATRLHVHEVAPRDGLQMESVFVPTEAKVAWIDQLSALGYAKIEVTSFVSPAAIPALRDAEAVMRLITRAPGVVYTALVPNVRGGERAIDGRVDEFNLVMSASATHNLANLRMTQAQSFRTLAETTRLAQQAGVAVNVSLSCAFGCPMEGAVPAATVADWVARFADLGVQGVTLCDTTGMADPGQVLALCSATAQAHPTLALTAHFHDTRGLGGANVFAALQAGITRFDASLGGIGGCPYAPGASGNVATEDLVHLLQCLGLDCGMDAEALAPAAQTLGELLGHGLPSAVGRAGPRWRRHPLPADFEQTRERALARELAM